MAVAFIRHTAPKYTGPTEQEPCLLSPRTRPVVMTDAGRRPSLHLVAAEAAPPDCTRCPHHDTLLAAGQCVPGDICLLAHSGRQIDSFLGRHPE